MGSQMSETNYPASKLTASVLSIVRGFRRSIMFFLFFSFLLFPVRVQAAVQPTNQKLANADFESGNMTGWTWQGNGWGGVENCCGQHNTPFWGTGTNPYLPNWPNVYSANTWDGSVSPVAGGDVQLYQNFQVSQNQKYRLSSWFQTSGLTAYLRRYSASLGGLVECANTANTAHTPLSCEFTATQNESMSFILEQGYGGANQWADSDDWTLTPISIVPRWGAAEIWATLPVLFYVDSTGYPTRTDIASWNWNNAMGKTMLQRTSNISQAGIRVVGVFLPNENWVGSTPPNKTNGVKVITLNRYWMDPWVDPPYRYGFEARESTISHEFGHALGLDDFYDNCQLMNGISQTRNWNCAVHKPTTGDVDGMRAIYP